MKFFKFVVKPLFFIGAAYCIFCFGSCSADRKAARSEANYEDLTREIEELKEENETMRDNMNHLSYAVSPTYDIPSAPAESATSTTVQAVTPQTPATDSNKVYISAVDVSIPQIAAEKEKPFATLVYCGQSFNITTYSEENRESLRDVTFPYYGTVERNGAVVISGVTVNGVYKLAEGSWEPVSGVKFDYVDNTYTFPVRAEGSYINIYMVQSVNSQHYYFGISAGNNK